MSRKRSMLWALCVVGAGAMAVACNSIVGNDDVTLATDAGGDDGSSTSDATTSDVATDDADASTIDGAQGSDADAGGDAADANVCETGVLNDLSNCGTCGNDCTSLPHVTGTVSCSTTGACVIPTNGCAAGFADCNGVATDGCEADLGQPGHCGSCTTACSGTTPVCSPAGSSYACTNGCPSTAPTSCSGACSNLNSDPKNCKTCGNACPTVTNGQATCTNGTCGLACAGGAALNACGGCGTLAGAPNAACGNCGTYACSANKASVVCNGDHALNACGGCATLSAAPASACGTCGSYACSADKNSVTCSGDHAKNACGGCATLSAAPGAGCGNCGTYVCAADNNSVTCSGDHALNACGGCSTLSPAQGSGCTAGTKGCCVTSGQYACSSANATACNAPAPPSPGGWIATACSNGSWDSNCDGNVWYSPSWGSFIPYSANYPNDGTNWPNSAVGLCNLYAGNPPTSGNGPWMYYPGDTNMHPPCGDGYIVWRCTAVNSAWTFTNYYCNGDPNYMSNNNCTIRNDLIELCE